MPDPRWVVHLDGGVLPDKEAIGGKAWSIARMRAIGLPVPPAFVISTAACRAFLEGGGLPVGLSTEIDQGIAWLEAETGREFGGSKRPLLVSVRSGAAISMPGMMDTVLNLGMSDSAEAALALETGLAGFARDTHLRFLDLYSSIVLKIPSEDAHPAAVPTDLRRRIEAAGHAVPESAKAQLIEAVRAVFGSWNARRARRYREHHGIAHDLGTAVTIQAMVFGNLDERSGTGVIFSRNPLSGERVPYGEYLPRAQGEDVVSGRFTPLPLDAMSVREPAAHAQLLAATDLLEREHGDIQDVEFTVQAGKLYLLQARSAKRAAQAAVRAAVDMVAERMIDVKSALLRVSPEQVRSLLLPRLREGATMNAAVVARGEGACPGVASGLFVFEPDEAERRAANGEDVILVRKTTSPDDIHGMIAARAVVTEQGGSTSHAAVVSRALGRPCVVGVGPSDIRAGGSGTVDGAAGVVYDGTLPVVAPREDDDEDLATLIAWARDHSSIRVLKPREATGIAGCIDLDARLKSLPLEGLAMGLNGAKAARGAALSNPAAAVSAVEQGIETLVTEPVLPALLAIMRMSR